jgi:glycosyltransferase involved in cell wall biosynthesis
LENAQILLAPSSKEGWGLTVHEAGSRGTPVVGYNVEGLRDVIIDGRNGILCKKNNYKELAIKSVDILKDKKLYEKLQKGAVEERKKFTWERTVNDFIKVI